MSEPDSALARIADFDPDQVPEDHPDWDARNECIAITTDDGTLWWK